MAVTKNITAENSKYGIAFSGAYYRIVTASVSRVSRSTNPKFGVSIDLSAYATTSPSEDTREVDFKRFSGPLEDIEAKSGDTFLAKCYTWVMDQSEMSGGSAS